MRGGVIMLIPVEPGTPEDQVPRRLAWEHAHPDAPPLAAPCGQDPMWRAVLDGGTVEIKALDLGLLLDKLEALDSPH